MPAIAIPRLTSGGLWGADWIRYCQDHEWFPARRPRILPVVRLLAWLARAQVVPG